MAVPEPQGFDLIPNELVTTLGKEGPETLPRPDAGEVGQAPPDELTSLFPQPFARSESPDSCYFAGYLGATFDARGERWCVLYVDLALQTWVLIQRSGILNRERILREQGKPARQDVLWVKADAAVCSGSGALSLEGLFLIGDFTRAVDFDEASLPGGTRAGGYGIEGQSPVRCCNRTVRRP